MRSASPNCRPLSGGCGRCVKQLVRQRRFRGRPCSEILARPSFIRQVLGQGPYPSGANIDASSWRSCNRASTDPGAAESFGDSSNLVMIILP